MVFAWFGLAWLPVVCEKGNLMECESTSAFLLIVHRAVIRARGRGFCPLIFRYIPGYFDIKPARWLHYSNLNSWLFFCISPRTSKISDSPVYMKASYNIFCKLSPSLLRSTLQVTICQILVFDQKLTCHKTNTVNKKFNESSACWKALLALRVSISGNLFTILLTFMLSYAYTVAN